MTPASFTVLLAVVATGVICSTDAASSHLSAALRSNRPGLPPSHHEPRDSHHQSTPSQASENLHSHHHRRRLPQYELGAMFHTLRFFANRIGEVNDKAYTAQEEEAAWRAALGSLSSSSSMDADAERAAAIEALRAKAAAAYGLTTEPATSASPTQPPIIVPSPSMHPVLAGMEW